jgi:cobalt-precorrin-5B (C1)-methyltransferase
MANERPLRRGWTTGACATAAAKAAYAGLLTGDFPDPVEIQLPGGQRVAFTLAETGRGADAATAGVIKDAGDDPDVTHGALVRATVRLGAPRSGVSFRAGPGVGMVTRPGLPLPPGEPAINPMPRQMICQAIGEVAAAVGAPGNVVVEISIPGGEALAERTLNPRLGIIGGLSVLGTTGVVIPYSCSAWIHGIRNGIDVARAAGLQHVAGATGRTSESAVQALYALPEIALIDMGDFVGGMLKHLRDHPVPRVSIAGGVAKITKLAQGRLDLHSKRGAADLEALAQLASAAGASDALASRITQANTVAECFELAREADFALGEIIAGRAREMAAEVLRGAGAEVEVLIFDRQGALVARSPFAQPHTEVSERNRRS